MLTGYRLMWTMVIFDLPVGTKGERKAATKFRNFLLDQGFAGHTGRWNVLFVDGHVKTMLPTTTVTPLVQPSPVIV